VVYSKIMASVMIVMAPQTLVQVCIVGKKGLLDRHLNPERKLLNKPVRLYGEMNNSFKVAYILA